MPQDSGVPAPRWRTCLTGGILAAALFLAVWIPTHSPRPHLPTSDLYSHLSVTRHLTRGEGFLTDVTYPLSFAFPFARELPQPLIHRQPGFSILLTVPYLAGGGYPGNGLDQVRRLQIILLGTILVGGVAIFLRRRNNAAVIPWLVVLFFNPLLVFAVDWGMVELACSLLMLILWLRTRGWVPDHLTWLDGLLAGCLCMLRLDLFWVPLLWWLTGRVDPTRVSATSRPTARRLTLVLLPWLLVVAPWVVRNMQVTGQPFFSLQTFAEHVKDTRSWPGYTVYRQLDPQPFLRTMTDDPVPVLRKAGRGVKFFQRNIHRLAPLPVIIILVWATLRFLARRLKRKPAEAGGPRAGPLALVSLTVVLLGIQYAFFDHSLRHLLVVVPVMFWEFSAWLGIVVTGLISTPNRRFRLPSTPGADIILATAAVLAVVFLFPCRVPGWDHAAAEAVNLTVKTNRQIDETRDAPAGVLFVDNSAVPWFIDRPVVWSPTKEDTRSLICDFLAQPEAKP